MAELLLRAGAACSLPLWSARIQAGAFSSASTQKIQPLQMYARLGCWAIASHEINLVARIDQGSQGTVYKAKWRGKAVAVKVFEDSHVAWDDEDRFENEIVVMSTLRHPNLVLFLGAVLDGPKKMLVTEFLEQGSLLDFYVRMWHTSEAPFLPRVEVLCSSLNSLLLICECTWRTQRSDRGVYNLIHEYVKNDECCAARAQLGDRIGAGASLPASVQAANYSP